MSIVALTNPSLELTRRLEQLLSERQIHADAVTRIDATLDQIRSALGASGGRRRGRPPGRRAGGDPSMMAMPGSTRRRRRRRSFEVKAEDFVLNLVREHKTPSTQEINKIWKSEGRGATADNTLTKLVKERRLKRMPLGEGVRGSRYSLP